MSSDNHSFQLCLSRDQHFVFCSPDRQPDLFAAAAGRNPRGNEPVTVVITRKNADHTYLILQKNIRTKLKWEGGRSQVLTLTIFNKTIPIVKVYSGRKKNEYDLMDIAFQVEKRIKKRSAV